MIIILYIVFILSILLFSLYFFIFCSTLLLGGPWFLFFLFYFFLFFTICDTSGIPSSHSKAGRKWESEQKQCHLYHSFIVIFTTIIVCSNYWWTTVQFWFTVRLWTLDCILYYRNMFDTGWTQSLVTVCCIPPNIS